jgi:hypothetical protein
MSLQDGRSKEVGFRIFLLLRVRQRLREIRKQTMTVCSVACVLGLARAQLATTSRLSLGAE